MTQEKILRYAFEEVTRKMFIAFAQASRTCDVIDECRYKRLREEFKAIERMIILEVGKREQE